MVFVHHYVQRNKKNGRYTPHRYLLSSMFLIKDKKLSSARIISTTCPAVYRQLMQFNKVLNYWNRCYGNEYLHSFHPTFPKAKLVKWHSHPTGNTNSPTFLLFLTTSLFIIVTEVQLLSVIDFTLST